VRRAGGHRAARSLLLVVPRQGPGYELDEDGDLIWFASASQFDKPGASVRILIVRSAAFPFSTRSTDKGREMATSGVMGT
jgi:hypothetical protein